MTDAERDRLRLLVQQNDVRTLSNEDLHAALTAVVVVPPVAGVLRWFGFAHFREPFLSVTRWFAELAINLATETRPDPELTVALRKLLEAKDAAVRAKIAEREP